MDLICRICQQSEVEELIPISCMVATQLERICNIISVVTGLSVEEYDRLPQHVCNECFGRLDRTYRLWKLCRGTAIRKVLYQKNLNVHRCRICCALIEGERCRKWDMDLSDMIQHLSGTLIEFNDNSVCEHCLIEMDAAYDFKSKCIESETSLLKKMSFVWERMEVDACNPEHLVIDLYAEAVQEQDCPGSVHCSVCLQEVEMQQLGKKCTGCMLQFRNYDVIQSAKTSLCAEESSRISPIKMDSVWIEENLSQEFIDNELDEKCLITGKVMCEENTEAENTSQKFIDDEWDEHFLIEGESLFDTNPKVENTSQRFIDDERDEHFLIEDESLFDTNPEVDNVTDTKTIVPSYTCLVYNGNSKIEYEIFESFPDDPFPKARPTGPFCCKCMKFFDTTFVLERHINLKHKNPTGRGEFSCDVCLSLFPDEQSLELHKVKLQNFFYDFCKSCQILLSTPNLLLQHKRKMHAEFETVVNTPATSNSVHKNSPKTAIIGNCPTEHNINPPRTNRPLDLKHPSVITNKSVSVDKNSTTAVKESYAMEAETNVKSKIYVSYECCLKNCRRRYPSKEQLLKHMNASHYQSNQPLGNVCQYCEVKFPNDTALLEHCNRKVTSTLKISSTQHSNQEPHVRSTSVHIIKQPAKNRRSLDLKHFSVVSKLDDYTDLVDRKGELCCKCFLVFDSREELTTHCEQHSAEGEHPFHCSICGRGFLRKSAHTTHKKLTENTIHYYCRLCKNMLWTNFDYKLHVAAHIKKQPAIQPKSGPLDLEQSSVVTDKSVSVDKNSKTSTEESNPMKVETNFKTEIYVTYDCCVNKCYNRYSSEELLLKHLNTAHNQPEQLLGDACQYCKKKFPNESALREHSNRKVERKMYRCLIDDCGFTRMAVRCMIQHCIQKPHVNSNNEAYKSPLASIKNRPLDLKHFSVVRKMDDNTDILKRKGELCCMCFLVFDSKEELATHCEQHSAKKGKKPFHCPVCGRDFATHGAYSSHRKLSVQSIHYFCRVCNKMLWTKHDYIVHRAALHFPDDENVPIETIIDTFFTCCGCKEQFGSEAELAEHRRERHPPPSSSSSKKIPKSAKCDYCHTFYTELWKLEKHIALYESNILYKCKLPSCTYSTKDLQHIRLHILGAKHQDTLRTTIFHANPSEHFCCIMHCEFRCQDYDTMIKHGRTVHAEKREYFSIANRNRKFKCQVCGKGFRREISLRNHRSRKQACDCQGCKKKNVKCEICDKVLASENSLKQHVKLIHSNDNGKREKFVCNICGKKVNNLTTHMESHANERKWVCKICDARFNHIQLLRNHNLVHTNERSYACRHGCEKRYKASGDRDRHEKLVHLGITPFRCEVCEASFIRLRDLRLHQRKHTGLKLFSCSHCFADFNKKSEYDDHCKQCRKSDL